MEKKTKTQKRMATSETHPKYEPPQVVTYQEDEILKQMGPVGGCVSPDYGGEAQAAPSYRITIRRLNRNEHGYRSSLYQEEDTE